MPIDKVCCAHAGPDGAPFRGAFVQARNAATKITMSVLSDNRGRYHLDDLAAGDYRLQIRAPGYKADAVSSVVLSAQQMNACACLGACHPFRSSGTRCDAAVDREDRGECLGEEHVIIGDQNPHHRRRKLRGWRPQRPASASRSC